MDIRYVEEGVGGNQVITQKKLLSYEISPTDHGYPLHIYIVDQNPSSTDPSIAKLKITLKGTYETVDRENPRETIEVAHNVSLTLDKDSYVNELS